MEFTVPAYTVEIIPFNKIIEPYKQLLEEAIQARDKWNQPVSKFHVWSAIRVQWAEKEIYTWSNFENVNFNGCTHAEQHAVNRANYDRKDQKSYDAITISQIAVVGALSDFSFESICNNKKLIPSLHPNFSSLDFIMNSFVTPCGHCRQIYDPYITDETKIILLNKEWHVAILPAKQLLPFSFSRIW